MLLAAQLTRTARFTVKVINRIAAILLAPSLIFIMDRFFLNALANLHDQQIALSLLTTKIE